jgi:hypothetical protein
MDKTFHRLTALVDAVLEEARTNQDFAAKLARALGGELPADTTKERTPAAERASESSPRRSNRRAKAVVDPFALLAVGEPHLRFELTKLNLEQLKDVVAEYGMDTSRLALKWKSPERLIDFIVTTVAARNRKGDVFRDSSVNRCEPGAAGSGTAS